VKKFIRYNDLPLKTKNGQNRQVEFVSNVYLVSGKKVIQCNIRDITERKQAEHLIRKAKHILKTLFNQAPIAIAIIGLDGHPTISNESLTKMLGYSKDELSQMKFTDFTYPKMSKEIWKNSMSLLKENISI